MAAQLDTTEVFVDGQTVNAARLNNLIDSALALEGIVSAQGADTTILATDKLLFWRSPGVLHRGLVSSMPGAGTVTSVSAVLSNAASVFNFTVGGVPTVTPQVTLGLDVQVPNAILAGPASGVSSAVPTFRQLVPADKVVAPLAVPLYLIDWTLADYFVKILPNDNVTRVLTLQNGSVGQVIKVRVDQGAAPGGSAVLNWTASGSVAWPGGVQPTLSTGASHRDIFEFVCTGAGTYAGIRWGANFL